MSPCWAFVVAMRVQSWRCGLLVCCSTLCYSVRILSVAWGRSWMPNWSLRSRSLVVCCCSLLLAATTVVFINCPTEKNIPISKNIFYKSVLNCSLCALRPAGCLMWTAAPWSCSENDSGPAAAAALDQPAHFPGRVQLGRGGPCNSELLWVLFNTKARLIMARHVFHFRYTFN